MNKYKEQAPDDATHLTVLFCKDVNIITYCRRDSHKIDIYLTQQDISHLSIRVQSPSADILCSLDNDDISISTSNNKITVETSKGGETMVSIVPIPVTI